MIYPIIFIFVGFILFWFEMSDIKTISELKNKKKLTIIIVSIILFLIGLSYIGITEHNAYFNAELVAKCGDIDLYYDTVQDTYFTVQENKFELFNIFERIPVSNELALEKIAAYEFLKEPLN